MSAAPPVSVGINAVPIPPVDLAAAGRLAEQLGYESLWIGEHIVVPHDIESAYPHAERPPFRADYRFVEPFSALGSVAAVTSEVRLGTCVLVLPLRDPFVTARSIATVDVVSNGRLEVGVGVGWLEAEFDIMGHDFRTRVARSVEMIELIDRLLRDDRPEFHGDWWDVPPVGFEPKPIQRPRPPLLLGGTSTGALGRAAALGDGWIGPMCTPDEAGRFVAELAERRGDRDRLTITVQGPADADLAAYRDAGVDRLIVAPWPRSSAWRHGMISAAERFGLVSRR